MPKITRHGGPSTEGAEPAPVEETEEAVPAEAPQTTADETPAEPKKTTVAGRKRTAKTSTTKNAE